MENIVLQSYQSFPVKFTELAKDFVEELRNSVKSTKFKKVLNKTFETIFMSPNLKSFGGKICNL
jgi:hypothetical protein